MQLKASTVSPPNLKEIPKLCDDVCINGAVDTVVAKRGQQRLQQHRRVVNYHAMMRLHT